MKCTSGWTLSSTARRRPSLAVRVPSSGTRIRRILNGTPACAGTTTTGIGTDVISCCAQLPTKEPCPRPLHAPRTTAATSAAAAAAAMVLLTGPLRRRTSRPLAVGLARTASSFPSQTWTTSRVLPKRVATASPVPTTVGAIGLSSTAAMTLLTLPSSRIRLGDTEPVPGLVHLDGASVRNDLRAWSRPHCEPARLEAHPNGASSEPQPHLQRRPLCRQMGIDTQCVALRPHPAEADDERLPHAAHGGEVHPASGASAEVFEVDLRCQPQRRHRLGEAAGPSEERGVDPRRERTAVSGARLVEVQVGHQGARRDLARDHVMEHQDVRLLDDLRALHPLGAE